MDVLDHPKFIDFKVSKTSWTPIAEKDVRSPKIRVLHPQKLLVVLRATDAPQAKGLYFDFFFLSRALQGILIASSLHNSRVKSWSDVDEHRLYYFDSNNAGIKFVVRDNIAVEGEGRSRASERADRDQSS